MLLTLPVNSDFQLSLLLNTNSLNLTEKILHLKDFIYILYKCKSQKLLQFEKKTSLNSSLAVTKA